MSNRERHHAALLSSSLIFVVNPRGVRKQHLCHWPRWGGLNLIGAF